MSDGVEDETSGCSAGRSMLKAEDDDDVEDDDLWRLFIESTANFTRSDNFSMLTFIGAFCGEPFSDLYGDVASCGLVGLEADTFGARG